MPPVAPLSTGGRRPVKGRVGWADTSHMLRSHVIPAIATIWGALIVFSLLTTGAQGDGAYSAGQYTAGLLGAAMVVLGVRAYVVVVGRFV